MHFCKIMLRVKKKRPAWPCPSSHYPDQPALLMAMADLAVEELSHYREVIRIMLARGITPAADSKDPYVNQLNSHIRRGSEFFLLDRLHGTRELLQRDSSAWASASTRASAEGFCLGLPEMRLSLCCVSVWWSWIRTKANGLL